MPRKSSGSVRVFYPRLSREEVLERLRRRLPELAGRLPLRKAVLFGSYARGNFTVASDIDLLLIYKGTHRGDAYSLARRLLAIPGLEVHAYSEEEYRRLGETVRRMEKDGIVVYGGKEER